ncbi:uncharacterized protein LOC132062226 [Lycium ferocissimum]|uniref:uncharacterized protein LOC132062226 n=1 Tax=Lycium ferocissimum TaxID=112874 RepID=UPI002814C25F|nr:uncharacterized protein LOC132062226 [Lycium ferocissimum]
MVVRTSVEPLSGDILERIINYCNTHYQPPPPAPARTEDEIRALENFDNEFVNVDFQTLKALVQAAHYLDIQALLDLTVETMKWRVDTNSEAFIRQNFPHFQ